MTPEALARALRLIVVSDPDLPSRHGHSVEGVVGAALASGARAIQLRDKDASALQLLAMALRLRALTREAGALLFVNDRADVALAAGADGVHLGPDDLPVAAARTAVPDGFLIGYSTDDPETARQAVADGADYLGCGDVFGTASKEGAGEVIGLARLDAVAAAVGVPVVAIGAVTPQRAADVARTRASGTAVIGAVMGSRDPGEAVRALLAPFEARHSRSATARAGTPPG